MVPVTGYRSYYEATAAPFPAQPALAGDVTCDVCVVGGGYTGLGAALHLAERGFRVVLLEAERIGWGASGRNGGQIHSGYSPGAAGLVALVGGTAAAELWQLAEEAKTLLRRRIARHDIACDWRDGTLVAATRTEHLADLRRELAIIAGDFGYARARLLDRDAVAEMVASPRYAGALYDEGGGHLHPLNLCRGLARAALSAGVRIFEASAVTRLDAGRRVTAVTAGGQVRADHAVVATNARLGNLLRPLAARAMPVSTYIQATEPLGENRARSLIRNDCCVCDTNFVLDYFRLSADHRLLFGGRASYTGRPPPDLAGSLRHRMLRVFPQLADVGVDYLWGGEVSITRNRLPHIGRQGGNVWFAHGFSGQGVALTGFAGQLIAEAIAGTAERFDVMAAVRHSRFPGGRLLRAPMLALAMLWYRLRDVL